MEAKDLLIVSQLRGNARAPVQGISRAVKLCRSVVAKRVRQLQSKIIQRYTALIDFGALGYHHHLLLLVSLSASEKAIFFRYVKGQVAVNNIYHVGNGLDYAIELVFRSEKESLSFLSNLEKGFSFETFHVFPINSHIIREAFLQDARSVLEVYHDSSL
jgi:DNA-binding Lrp family transcriptional regulator